jgi:transposase InsO family protein
MERIRVTMQDIARYKVLTEVVEGTMSLTEAAGIIGLCYRQALRLKQRLISHGVEGIIRKTPAIPPNRKVTKELKERILQLRTRLYYDFNMAHFWQKLTEIHGIALSYESIRQLLIRAEDHVPKKRRKVYRQRRRMPKAGMLVQMDSSEHRWLEHIPEDWSLVAMIDDATSEVPVAQFFPSDTTFANMEVIRRFIEYKGLFNALYVDKASHFTTTRKGGLHYEVDIEQDDTQIERALDELDIVLIPANSPQAKGRVERLFRTLQDRLIKEMRLAKIQSYGEANVFLKKIFLPDHNRRFSLPAEAVYRSLPVGTDLSIIFSRQCPRVVANDNTIQIYGYCFQLPPSTQGLSLAGRTVTVCVHDNNALTVLYKKKPIFRTVFSRGTKVTKKQKVIEQILNERAYVKARPRVYALPSKNHPWRQYPMTKLKAQKEVVAC